MLTEKVMFTQEPAAVVIESLPDNTRRVLLRADAHEETAPDGESTAWAAREAVMLCAPDDCPTVEEITEDFETWFDYAAAWTAPRQKTVHQMQADIDYIAAMCGIDLEG